VNFINIFGFSIVGRKTQVGQKEDKAKSEEDKATGRLKMQDWKMTDHRKAGGWKMQDWNLADQIAGLENAGPENAGQNVFDF